jgi:hypothetical protein
VSELADDVNAICDPAEVGRSVLHEIADARLDESRAIISRERPLGWEFAVVLLERQRRRLHARIEAG